MTALQPSDLAPGLLLGPEVELPGGVTLGANVVVHGGVIVEEGCTIQDGAVVGKPAILGPHTRATPPGPDATTRLAHGSAIGAYAILVAGAEVGPDAVVGDRSFVREGVRVGAEAVLGGGCQIGSHVPIGRRAKLMNNTLVGRGSVIEADVFCGPAVMTVNDMTLGRHRLTEEIRGATLRRACRIGAGALLLPGIEVGEEAFVAAGSLVTRDVAPRTLVMGSPARPVQAVGDEELLERFHDGTTP